jgi:hypothetical protein
MAEVPYQWDQGARRWRDNATGRFVTPLRVRDALEGTIDAAERMVALSIRLALGEITIAEWQRSLIEEIKDLHVNAARGAGGAELSPKQWGIVGAELRQQYTYLARLGAQVASGAQPLDGVFLTRVSMYAHAARALFERVRGQGEKDAGMDVEWNVRHAGDSCRDCIQATQLGRVPIATLIPIGRRRCLTRCRCTLEYGRSEEFGT